MEWGSPSRQRLSQAGGAGVDWQPGSQYTVSDPEFTSNAI